MITRTIKVYVYDKLIYENGQYNTVGEIHNPAKELTSKQIKEITADGTRIALRGMYEKKYKMSVQTFIDNAEEDN